MAKSELEKVIAKSRKKRQQEDQTAHDRKLAAQDKLDTLSDRFVGMVKELAKGDIEIEVALGMFWLYILELELEAFDRDGIRTPRKIWVDDTTMREMSAALVWSNYKPARGETVPLVDKKKYRGAEINKTYRLAPGRDLRLV